MSEYYRQETRQQAKFREESQSISEPARTPDDPEGIKHKYLLALGCENENLIPLIRDSDKALRFFKERKIPWWKAPASDDNPDPNIPTRNMASSQIACVNFLMPLADEPEALASLIRSFDKDVSSVEVIEDNSTGKHLKSCVEFEWVGKITSLEQNTPTRGEYATSVDALVLAETELGRRRAYLIEWKYTERYKVKSLSHEKRRKWYSQMFEADDSPFLKPSLSLDDWFFEPLHQIMRLLLLSRKMIRENEFDVTEARVVVACPRGNTAYRNTITSKKMREEFPDSNLNTVVRKQLAEPDLFKVVAVEDLFDAVSRSSRNRTITEWSSYNQERYCWGGQ